MLVNSDYYDGSFGTPGYTDEHTSTEQFGVDNFEVLLSIESA